MSMFSHDSPCLRSAQIGGFGRDLDGLPDRFVPESDSFSVLEALAWRTPGYCAQFYAISTWRAAISCAIYRCDEKD